MLKTCPKELSGKIVSFFLELSENEKLRNRKSVIWQIGFLLHGRIARASGPPGPCISFV